MHTQMPTQKEEHRKLQGLAGSWLGKETIYPSAWDTEGGPATSRLEARMSLGGFFLLSEYVERRNDRVIYEGHGVYGWDPVEECYTMHWFDGMGGNAGCRIRGRWEGNILTFENMSPQGRTRYLYTLESVNHYFLRIESATDGEHWTTFMEGEYRRG